MNVHAFIEKPAQWSEIYWRWYLTLTPREQFALMPVRHGEKG